MTLREVFYQNDAAQLILECGGGRKKVAHYICSKHTPPRSVFHIQSVYVLHNKEETALFRLGVLFTPEAQETPLHKCTRSRRPVTLCVSGAYACLT